MNIIKNIFFTLIFTVVVYSCNRTDSSVTFKDYKLFDYYTIKVPLVMNEEKEGVWVYATDKYVTSFEIDIVKKENKTLEQHLNVLIEECNKAPNDKKKLISKDTLTVNGLKGIIAYYEQDNSSGAFPVLSYYVISAFQDDNDILKINSISTQKKYSESLKTSIRSIKKLNQDSIKLDTLAEKKDLQKMKQLGYQVFKADNFIIKCDCQLKLNSNLQQEQKEQGNPLEFSPYVCAVNENSYETGEIYNINVIDLNPEYNKLARAKEHYFTKEYLKSYSSNLTSSGINYTEVEFNNVKALEYSFSQMEMPTKAIFFVKNKKSYLLQVSTRKRIKEKFNNLKSSFSFIN